MRRRSIMSKTCASKQCVNMYISITKKKKTYSLSDHNEAIVYLDLLLV